MNTFLGMFCLVAAIAALIKTIFEFVDAVCSNDHEDEDTDDEPNNKQSETKDK